jgi:hypothetical protein
MPNEERNQSIFSKTDAVFAVRVGIGILSFLLFSVIILRVIYPFDTGNAESLSWVPAQHLLEGKNPYAFSFTPPYSMTPYGVVYYALIAVGIKIFGLQIWWGRILSVLSFAVCLWAATKITKKLTGSEEAALVTLLAGLAMFPMQMWIGLMRSDLMAAAFACLALYLAFTVERKDKITFWRITGIVLLAVAAFFTKHTYLLPIGFIFLRFWQIDKRREALISIFSFAALVGVFVFLLNFTSSGGYVWQHFVHAQRLPFAYKNLINHFPAGPKLPAFLLFFVFLVIFIFRKRKVLIELNLAGILNVLHSPKLLIFLYFIISFVSALASSGRIGANVNYYIENSFAVIILSGLIYNHFRRNDGAKLAFALIISLTLGGAFQIARILRGEYFRWQSLGYYQEIFQRASELTPPNSACASAMAEMVIWNNCQLHFDDYQEYAGDWSPELREIFEREIKAGRYAVIIWYNDELHQRFPKYRLVAMSQKVPDRFYPVYLYVRSESQGQ